MRWHNLRHMTNGRVKGQRALPLLPPAAESWVRRVMDDSPVVVLMGPRQTGKSTLARKIADEAKPPETSEDYVADPKR